MSDFQDGSIRTDKRKHNKKEYLVLMGKLKDKDSMAEHSYHYQKSIWKESEAKSHCTSHKGMFEPAMKEKKSEERKEVRMAKLNIKGKTHCLGLIAAGKVDRASIWTVENEERTEVRSEEYLGIEDTDVCKFPFAFSGKVYRSALLAIKQRSIAQGLADITEAVDECLHKIDSREQKVEDSDIEQRTVSFSVEIEERAAKDGTKKECLRGHAAVFNQETVVAGWFREIILPGAFSNTIQEDDQRALFNHDPNFVLGRRMAGTLRLSEDSQGLAIEIDPPDTQFCRDLVLTPIKRGDIDQMSFSFRIKKQDDGTDGVVWENGEDGGD